MKDDTKDRAARMDFKMGVAAGEIALLTLAMTRFHADVLDVIAELAKLDPPADSPEAKLLATLADATERYERAVLMGDRS